MGLGTVNKIVALPASISNAPPSARSRGDLAAAAAAIRELPDLQLLVAYDAFAMRTMMVRPPPWEFDQSSFVQRPWEDNDDLNLTEHLQRAGIPVKVITTSQAVQMVAKERSYHPPLEYLESLEWDRQSRLERLFPDYFGTNDDAYTTSIGRTFMIGAVARITQPGTKHDHIPIIEGNQGLGKSSALRRLFEPWFTDEIADLGSKDAALQMAGVWCIELSELDAYSRAETARIKAWTSRTVDRFRPPYGSRVIESPRSCVFAGTTNHDCYLKDETGNRRFWPVRANKIKLCDIERDRDQLWAEAVALYHAGVAWWLLNPEAISQAKAEQMARLTDDPWEEAIGSYISDKHDVTVSEILFQAIGVDRSRMGQTEQNRVSRCLRARGWLRIQVRTGDKRSWRYQRGAQ
ncbi:virulence-associated E family protein [Bradyrhizobium brasilense]|uniref:virulence-associated E family protein n=1 Tax=Bradyrhizobium brasilense TaxID=1419277 RepID=UPI001E6198C2|nr:virulence-associated E family protein [Bradyrhizobium brasilense]MCC8972157.1 virulence-associated E family protein [Bradyrhizobium brasilense]